LSQAGRHLGAAGAQPVAFDRHPQMPILNRRRFVTTLAALGPVRALAQAPGKVARVGFLSSGPRPTDAQLPSSAWRQEMQRLGWVEGRNLVVERRFADGKFDLMARYARELVDARLDLLVTMADPDAVEVRKLGATLPIVVIYNGLDPVEDGLIASFARPGGNVTGVSRMLGETRAKRLELIKTLMPAARRGDVLFAPSADAGRQARFESRLRDAARAAHVDLSLHPCRNQGELMAAFPALASAGTSAFLLEPTFQTFASRLRIAELAMRHRLAGVFTLRQYAEAGGLMSCGPDWPTLERQLAQQVDRVLRGARPAELPMEQPGKFELVINVATAKAIDLAVPRALLLRADEVIG